MLAPAPSLGVACAMVLTPGPLGQSIFVACKLWILAFPAFWWLVVERRPPSLSPARQGGLGVGAVLGVVMAGAIVKVYLVVAVDRLDPQVLHASVAEMGLDSPGRYLLAGAYWILVNSLLEEYVYRWFVSTQFERLLPRTWAVVGAALVFTPHHVIAVQDYMSPAFTALASLGVFLAGATWSWLYLRYRSIWPGWISHLIADVAIYAIGWRLVFAS